MGPVRWDNLLVSSLAEASPVAWLLIKLSLLLAVAWCVYGGLEDANPRWRTLVWRSAALAIPLLAVATFARPVWTVDVARPIHTLADLAPASPPIKRNPAAEPAPKPTSFVHVNVPANAARSAVAKLDAPPEFVEVVTPTTTPPAAPMSMEQRWWPRSLSGWLVAAWFVGVGIGLLRLFVGHRQVARLVATSSPCDAWVDGILRNVADGNVAYERIQLRQSHTTTTPFVWGLRRTTLMLPQSACEPSHSRDLTAIFAHELSHVRGHDLWWNALLRIEAIMLWFHPLAWKMTRAHAYSCELIGDAVAADHVGGGDIYSRTLARVAIESSAVPSAFAMAMSRDSDVTRRIAALDRRVFREKLPRRRTALVVLMAGALTFGMAGGRVSYAEPRTEPEVAPTVAVPAPAATPDSAAPSAAETTAPAAVAAETSEVQPARGPFTARANQITDVNTSKRSWGPEQALGEPDTFQAGDIVTAWASRSQDDQDEWLTLEYEEAVIAKAVVVHETYNPGSIVKVSVFDEAGNEMVAWEGQDPTPSSADKGVSVFPIKVSTPVKHVKLYIDSKKVSGWNEIDAVGLTGPDETQWAIKAEASSTYAENSGGQPQPIVAVDPNILSQQAERITTLESEVASLRKEVERVKALETQLEELKKLLEDKVGK